MKEKQTMKVLLTVEVEVHDPKALVEYARELYENAWPGEGSFDELTNEGTNIGEVLFEALVASNGTPRSPLDYGIEIMRHEVTVA